jgi:TRAP-type mannitol/chloroaromatic compound transport system permease large subunit
MVFDLIEVFIGGLIHNPVMVEVLNELNNRLVWFGTCNFCFVFTLLHPERSFACYRIKEIPGNVITKQDSQEN